MNELGETVGHRRVLLDGELVCLAEDGRPDFGVLRARLGRRPSHKSRPEPATFVAFDALHLDGHSTRALPWEERRHLLDDLALGGERCWVPRAFGDGAALLAACQDQELEGVVAKRRSSRYLPGRRSDAWAKHKLRRCEAFVVAGYSVSTPGKPDELFLARASENGELVPAGSTGYGGLDADSREQLREVLREYTLPAGRTRRRRMHHIETPVLWLWETALGTDLRECCSARGMILRCERPVP